MIQTPPNPGMILLATDGSPSARSAAYGAAQIALALQWRLHAVYVIDVSQAFDLYSNINQELKELGTDPPQNEQRITLFEEQGTLALSEIQNVCVEMGLIITTEMIIGDVSDTILKSASNYSLLALGQRGNRHESDSQHLGSNFRQIAHHSPIPVLIGDRENIHKKFKRILLAYDGTEFSIHALDWVEHMQKLFTQIIAVSVDETKDGNVWLNERKKEIADSSLTKCEFVGEKGNAGEIIAATAYARHADMIVMGSYHHSQFLEWARHSTLNTVLRDVNLPILAAQ